MKPYRRPLAITPQSLYDAIRNHGRVLNQQVSFGSQSGTNNEADRNIQCSKAQGTTPSTANTEFSVTHNLGRIPVTFFGHVNQSGTLYKSTTAWTKTTIYLKCSAASASYSLVII